MVRLARKLRVVHLCSTTPQEASGSSGRELHDGDRVGRTQCVPDAPLELSREDGIDAVKDMFKKYLTLAKG